MRCKEREIIKGMQHLLQNVLDYYIARIDAVPFLITPQRQKYSSKHSAGSISEREKGRQADERKKMIIISCQAEILGIRRKFEMPMAQPAIVD